MVPTNFVKNGILYLFCPFVETKNKNQYDNQITRNVSVFLFMMIRGLYRSMPNRIDFYKGCFLLIILVFVIVSWYILVQVIHSKFLYLQKFFTNL